MGRRLVAAACMPLGDLGLSPRARLVLVAMANQAKDSDVPPVYFGGWPYLIGVLGFTGYTGTSERAVARAIAELRAAKVIDPRAEPMPGRNVEYVIRL